ncbi:hypothetical protein [Halioxenophilus aromaticivorans]|uniref:Uncharacterized protein n=1 Tax=Halioxenophilus aromaticivorans TaxID=1306992 RepID=A0AAV3U333_9ALTE
MSNVSIPLQLAPSNLSQSILPNWGFSFFNINLGSSSNPEIEQEVLEKVGSYGKQIGRLSEALEVVISKLDLLEKDLTTEEKDAVIKFLGDVAEVRSIKNRINGAENNR